MNLRREHGRLRPHQCQALNHAWTQALRDGFPLNVLLSIRPEPRTPLDHAELVAKTWNRLGVWSRRHTAARTFHGILVRETTGGEHFHVLMHVSGSANLTRLRFALARWFPNGEAHVTRANYEVGYTPSGKIRSAHRLPGRDGNTALVIRCLANGSASAPISGRSGSPLPFLK